MASKGKKKATAAPRKGKTAEPVKAVKEGETTGTVVTSDPVAPVEPVEPEQIPEPPENWGTPFTPSTPSKVMREAAYLLKLGVEFKADEVLALPEFAIRILWVIEQAARGYSMTPMEGAMTDAAWDDLKAQTANYMANMQDDGFSYVMDNPNGIYSPPTVSEYIRGLQVVTDWDGSVKYLVAQPIAEFKYWCLQVARKNAGYNVRDNFLEALYAGRHKISGDGNDTWRSCWMMNPDKWSRFHAAFREKCARIGEEGKIFSTSTSAKVKAKKAKSGNDRSGRKPYTPEEHYWMQMVFTAVKYPLNMPRDGWPTKFDYAKAATFILENRDEGVVNGYEKLYQRFLANGCGEIIEGLKKYVHAYKRDPKSAQEKADQFDGDLAKS